jgi:hypothetical protein
MNNAAAVFLILQILTIQSAIIRNPNTDMCLDGRGDGTMQRKCEAGSPHQSWNLKKIPASRVVQIELEGSKKCISRIGRYEHELKNCTLTKKEKKSMGERKYYYQEGLEWYQVKNEEHRIGKVRTGIVECLTLLSGGTIACLTCGNAKGNDSQDVFYE